MLLKMENKQQINGRTIIEQTEVKKHKNKWLSLLSIILILIAVAYLIMPYDYDHNIVGKIDDFMFFMSAFCFLYSQFMSKYKVKAALILKMLSVVFVFIGALSLLLLVFVNS